MYRKKFYKDEIYHVFNKSIANYQIFRNRENKLYFLSILDYYNDLNSKVSLSKYILLNGDYKYRNVLLPRIENIVKFISFNIMPDHFHFVLKVINVKLIYHYLNNIGNSYTRYFNTKYERKGPLWQSPYKMVRVKSNEQLLHLTRYVHLNATTSNLVKNPEDWEFSSYRDFIYNEKILREIMTEVSIKNCVNYKKFVENNKDYQRKLKIIKKLILE